MVFLYKMLTPIEAYMKKVGLGIQLIIMICITIAIKKLIKKYDSIFQYLKNKIVRDTLLVYALIWMLITIVLINDIPRDIFELAP